jgi:hypothetical protein
MTGHIRRNTHLLIIGIGLVTMLVLEIEKGLLRRWRVFDELGPGTGERKHA